MNPDYGNGRRVTTNVTAYTSADDPFIPDGVTFLIADDPFNPPTREEMLTARDIVRLDALPTTERDA